MIPRTKMAQVEQQTTACFANFSEYNAEADSIDTGLPQQGLVILYCNLQYGAQ